jgi:hypothetical protein
VIDLPSLALADVEVEYGDRGGRESVKIRSYICVSYGHQLIKGMGLTALVLFSPWPLSSSINRDATNGNGSPHNHPCPDVE